MQNQELVKLTDKDGVILKNLKTPHVFSGLIHKMDSDIINTKEIDGYCFSGNIFLIPEKIGDNALQSGLKLLDNENLYKNCLKKQSSMWIGLWSLQNNRSLIITGSSGRKELLLCAKVESLLWHKKTKNYHILYQDKLTWPTSEEETLDDLKWAQKDEEIFHAFKEIIKEPKRVWFPFY